MARVAAKPIPETTTGPSSSRPLKKRLDQPSGVKNKFAAGAARQLPAVSVTKQTPASKAAPGAPKISTARLEAQIVKLERALVRSRERVEKLEVIVSELNKNLEMFGDWNLLNNCINNEIFRASQFEPTAKK